MPDFNASFRVAAFGNILFAFAKLAAALWTGSTALMAIAVQALAAASSLGMIQNNRSHDRTPSQPGSTYFWACAVPILVFSLGAGVTITQGIERLRAPLPGQDSHLGILVVAAALLFHLAWRWRASAVTPPAPLGKDANAVANPDSNPIHRTAMLVNAAGIAGTAFALASLAATRLSIFAPAEALGSIMIGLTQGFVAANLAIDTQKALDHFDRRPIIDAETSANASTPVAAIAAPAPVEPERSITPPEAVRPSEPPKRNHPPSVPSRKAKKRRH